MILNAHYADAIGQLADRSVQLVWTDPPFGTGELQRLRSPLGTTYSYMDDSSAGALHNVVTMMMKLEPKLTATAVVAVCLDYRIVHEAKVAIQQLGLYQFEQELVFHFELGGTSKTWWTNKHNTILLWSLGAPTFHLDQVPDVERKAPRGTYTSAMRKANSVFSITMGPTNAQRTGYPNQKPLQLVEPFVLVHSDPGDLVFDPFAGSGTTGVAAQRNGRRYVMCDINQSACVVMRNRGLS